MTPHGTRLSTLLCESRVSSLAAIGADPLVCGASLDSRRVQPGDLFFAIRGAESDGESFVPDAISRGACAVVAVSPRPRQVDTSIAWVQVDEVRRVTGPLSRECYGRPDEALQLVGVTDPAGTLPGCSGRTNLK